MTGLWRKMLIAGLLTAALAVTGTSNQSEAYSGFDSTAYLYSYYAYSDCVSERYYFGNSRLALGEQLSYYGYLYAYYGYVFNVEEYWRISASYTSYALSESLNWSYYWSTKYNCHLACMYTFYAYYYYY